MAARQGAPVLGAICTAGQAAVGQGTGSTFTRPLSPETRWQINVGYRWQRSFRHFRGDHEEANRIEENTEVENKLHLFDVGVNYQASPRWSFSVSVPFMTVDRISHGPGTITGASGIGDMSVGAKFWIFRPPTESRQNVQIGFSMKLPTGKSNVTDRVGDSTIVVDQSIQPGDSGTGFSLDYTAFKSVGRFTLFSTGVYLFNPKNSYTPTGWKEISRPPGYPGYSRPGTEYSVADQYLFQAGVGWVVPKVHGLALTGTGRIEGVPARDIIGGESGFRRPGYAVSAGPGVMYSRGGDTWSVSIPIALYRNRTRSVSDIERGTHGDAAFADYLILVGYSRTF
ncbi:MAG TPA: hypothetical protein PLP42_21575 [Acidobacteriota bacterium]|nr:hypothetical protein [Acidobacteriota bacterium]